MSARMIFVPERESNPDTLPLRALMSPMTSPMHSSGIVISIFITGSKSTGEASSIAFLKPIEPAI